VLDGPVYIPKLYDGRNKSFFMANYEGWRIKNGANQKESFPNPAVLTGDFSAETYPALSTQIINGTSVALPGGPLPAYGTLECSALINLGYNCMPVDPTTGSGYAGNKVPASVFTGNVGKMAVANNYYPAPTLTGKPEGVTNYIKSLGFPLVTNQQTYRGDQNLGKAGSVFFRFTKSSYTNQGHYNSSDLVHGVEYYYENQKNWELSHTINIGQSNVNNFRFGYLDAYAPQGGPIITPAAVSQLALTGVFTHFTALQQTWPSLGMTSYSGVGGSGNAYSGSDQPAWEYADSFTTVKGRHTLGIGVDYRRWRLIRNLDDDFYGDWGFSSGTIINNSLTIPAGNPGAGTSSCPTLRSLSTAQRPLLSAARAMLSPI